MAELILTDEERAAESFLDWDDASLGRLVRHCASLIDRGPGDDDREGRRPTTVAAAALLLISEAVRCKSEQTTIALEGCTLEGGVEVGDWKVVLTRVSAPPCAPACGNDGFRSNRDGCEYVDGVCVHCGEEVPY